MVSQAKEGIPPKRPKSSGPQTSSSPTIGNGYSSNQPQSQSSIPSQPSRVNFNSISYVL